jgi:hypothetical protein
MQRSTLTGQRLVAVFLIGFVLFNYPVLSLFDRPATLFGLPLVFAYLFLVWAGVILLMAWVVERKSDRGERIDRSGG